MTESKRYIYKRNGQSAVFNIEKIISAIKKSRKSISFDQNVETDYQIVNNILSELDISYYSKNKVPTVEDIQNIVEDSLIKFDEYKTAKAYILYRFEHKINRDVYTKDGLSRYQKYIDFMDEYSDAINAASGSKYDPNSNVEVKNISTMAGEIFKKDTIMINRLLMYEKITDMYGEELAKEYIRQLESHEIYKHDETSILPYCVAITMYPFLLDGLTKVGGHSSPPKHLQSFLGSFINLVFIIASQFAGAVATPEFIMYMDYFVRKEYGNDYYQTDAYDTIIKDSFQQVVYSMNQPCAARNFQCVREDTTQLWTPNGFKYYHELKEGDKCYVWKDGKYSIERIKKLNSYDYEGNLVQFKGRNYQQTVTPNHRVVYKIPNTDKYNIKEAKELVGHSKLSLPISANITKDDYPISDDLLKLCTYTYTDGSLSFPHEGCIPTLRYYLSKNRSGYQKIKNSLEALGIGYTENQNTTCVFGDSMTNICLTSVDGIVITRTIEYTKKKISDMFLSLSERQAKMVIDCWSETDGQKLRDGALLLQCDNLDIADTMQQVCLLGGYGSKIFKKECNKFDGSGKTETIYVRTFKRDCKRVSEYNEIPYKGKVWCPSTDAGVVIFREENKVPYISGNSVFWNVSYFDKNYFESMFGNFYFPDATKPQWESVDYLQRKFMTWFNDERKVKMLTFPVETMALLSDGKDNYLDKEYADLTAKMYADGHSFFTYVSDSADSLSSCCRLKNEITENVFSFSLGAGGVATGSKSVMTINVNRMVQLADQKGVNIDEATRVQVNKIQKYQTAFNEIVKDKFKKRMLPVYDAGFISLDKQYLTIGLNGLVEAAESRGLKVSNNDDYINFVESILKPIYEENKKAKTKDVMFNTEFVPAEGLGVKNATWDREAGLIVPRDVYNSYFYVVEDEDCNIIDKFILHGKQLTQYLDGGSALHMNLDEHLTEPQYRHLLNTAVRVGCNYFTFNIPNTICNECGYISKHMLDSCPSCGSKNVDYATRIIGYLKRVSSFSLKRQEEESRRFYA